MISMLVSFGDGVGVRKLALVDEVAAKLLAIVAGKSGGRAEGLDTVAVSTLGVVDVLLVDALLVTRAIHGRNTGPAGINVHSVVLGLLVQADLQLSVIPSIGGNLGGVEGENLGHDGSAPSRFGSRCRRCQACCRTR